MLIEAMDKTRKDITIIELNEFNVELLENAVAQHSLPNIKKLLAFKKTNYRTDDRYNSGNLEPWVQWTSIHSGVPIQQHGIKHLGDISTLTQKQFWQTLSDNGISSGIWGAINATRNSAKHCRFFLPCPWTFSESACPNKLNSFLNLTRYVAKNQLNLSTTKLSFKLLSFLKSALTLGISTKLLLEYLNLRKNLVKLGKQSFVYLAYFEFASTLIFSKMKKKHKPQVSIIFLHTLAYLQRYFWRAGTNTITSEMLYGLNYLDKILGHLFNQFKDNTFVIHNGLTQTNTNHETPWVIYAFKKPLILFKALGINPTSIEQNMTNDGHIFLKNKVDCQKAYDKISSVTINDKPMFNLEKHQANAKQLFYKLNFTQSVNHNTIFKFGNKTFSFLKFFEEIATKTGRHLQLGTVFSQEIDFPNHIFNHEFNKFIYSYLMPEKCNVQSTNQVKLSLNKQDIEALCNL